MTEPGDGSTHPGRLPRVQASIVRAVQILERAYRIHGHVQGVGFRWWTRSQALRLGVTGTVQNCSDGTVEVQAHGPADRVAQFERRLWDGPAGARVRLVEQIPAHDVPTRDFQIIRQAASRTEAE